MGLTLKEYVRQKMWNYLGLKCMECNATYDWSGDCYIYCEGPRLRKLGDGKRLLSALGQRFRNNGIEDYLNKSNRGDKVRLDATMSKLPSIEQELKLASIIESELLRNLSDKERKILQAYFVDRVPKKGLCAFYNMSEREMDSLINKAKYRIRSDGLLKEAFYKKSILGSQGECPLFLVREEDDSNKVTE